jgi:hypothetical protein
MDRPTINVPPPDAAPITAPPGSPVRGANERQAAIAALLRTCSTENEICSQKTDDSLLNDIPLDEEAIQEAAVKDMGGLMMSCSDCGCDLTIADLDAHDCSGYKAVVEEMLDDNDPTQSDTERISLETSSESAYLSPNPNAQAKASRSLGITVTAVGGGCFTEVRTQHSGTYYA